MSKDSCSLSFFLRFTAKQKKKQAEKKSGGEADKMEVYKKKPEGEKKDDENDKEKEKEKEKKPEPLLEMLILLE